jgi:hypothetical protein
MPSTERLSFLLIPFRNPNSTHRLPEGYTLLQATASELAANSEAAAEQLNRLLLCCGEQPRSPERWLRVLERSAWQLGITDRSGRLVGFVRATSDQALNANLWDLLSDPEDPGRMLVLAALVQAALGRLRRELGGCSVSLSAPPEALEILRQAGFMVDPGGIRAMGLALRRE